MTPEIDGFGREFHILDDIATHAGCGLLILDRDSNVVFANQLAAKWFGPSDHLFGRNASVVLGTRAADNCGADASLRTGKSVRGQDFHVQFLDEDRELSPMASPLRDANGAVTHIALVISDLTETKRSEKWLRRAFGELRQRNEEIASTRKASEEAVRASEDRYRSLVEALDEGVVVWDAEGRVVTCNPAAERILGVAPGSLTGLDHSKFPWKAFREGGASYPARDHPSSITRLTKRPCSGAIMGICHPGKSLQWLSVSSRPLGPAVDSAPCLVVTYFSDITDRRQADAKAALLTRQLALLLESTDIGFFGTDIEGRCTFLNSFGACLLGCQPEDLLGRDIYQLIHHSRADGRPIARADCAIHQVLSTGLGLRASDQVFWRLDGKPIPVEYSCYPIVDSGVTVGAVVSFKDISERRKTEEALFHSEARFRAFFETAAMGMSLIDNSGCIVECNPAFARMLGYAPEDLVGVTSEALTVPEDVDEQVSLRQELVDGTRDFYQIEKRYLRKDGKVFWGRLTVSIVRGTGNEPLFRIGIVEDINSRKELEEQLRRAQRLETAGRIAGQVAHDFNNLLSPLSIYPDVISSRLPEGHPARKYCEAMVDSIQAISDVNTDLLTLGRRAHIEQQVVDLSAVIRQALERLIDAPTNIHIDTDISPDLFGVKGSASQLLRVFVNLVTNGLESMPEGGLLSVKAENVYVDEPGGRLARVPIGEYVRLSVRDTGQGIPPEIEDRIFDAFFTTKLAGKKPGSGLGLSVVHAVVTDHGGYVDLKSEPGKGTTFFVYLPVCREQTSHSVEARLIGGTGSILIVDDDAAQREAVGELLSGLGYQVETAASGESALGMLRNRRTDLLLLDMIMPGGIDGAETLRVARIIQQDIKAIILSGFAESERVELARKLGAGQFVRKPASAYRLTKAISDELKRVDAAEQS